MANKRPPFNANALTRGAMRRVFSRSPVVREVLMEGRREVPRYNKDGSRAKKDAVQYNCQVCLLWVKSSEMSVDHIDPVISTNNGFVDWNTFYDRLHCSKSNLQRICDTCHNKKTNAEKFRRMYVEEWKIFNDMKHSSGPIPPETIKRIVKKFTKKRLDKYPYPQDFKDTVIAYRRSIGLKV